MWRFLAFKRIPEIVKIKEENFSLVQLIFFDNRSDITKFSVNEKQTPTIIFIVLKMIEKIVSGVNWKL